MSRERRNVIKVPGGMDVVVLSSVRDESQVPDAKPNKENRRDIFDLEARLGIPLIELATPQAGGDQEEVFCMLNKHPQHNRLVAFGSPGKPAVPFGQYKKRISDYDGTNFIAGDDDPSLNALIKSGANILTIVVKSSNEQVTGVLNWSPEHYPRVISESVRYLKHKGRKIIHDAEHFFSGLNDNPEDLKRYLRASIDAKADNITLCDTKGIADPDDVEIAVRFLKDNFPDYKSWGFHAHNDLGLAVANTWKFVQLIRKYEMGIPLVQLTLTGLGERGGNCPLAPLLVLFEKKGLETGINNSMLYDASNREAKLLGVRIPKTAHVIGQYAGVHTGGQHVDSVGKGVPYLGYNLDDFGGRETIDYSENSGAAAAMVMASEFGYKPESKNDPRVRALLKDIKSKSLQGYILRQGTANRALLVEDHFGEQRKQYFSRFEDVDIGTGFIVESFSGESNINGNGEKKDFTRSTIVGYNSIDDFMQERDEVYIKTGQSHKGPVAATFKAMKELLKDKGQHWIDDVRLVDWNEDIVLPNGVESVVGAYVELSYNGYTWNAFGVGANSVAASQRALRIGVEYALMMMDKGEWKVNENNIK